MTNLFLRAKHWHLFSLLFGVPVLFQIWMMVNVFSGIAGGHNPDPSILFNYFKVFPALMILVLGVYFGWFWSVATGLQKMLPQGVTMKLMRFKVFFWIPLTYIILVFVWLGMFMTTLMENMEQPDAVAFGQVGSFIGIFLVLHLFSMFCIFHTIFFVAKTISTVELQRETVFSDFVGDFFLIWFYPIGIWIIQPRVNKIIERYNNISENTDGG